MRRSKLIAGMALVGILSAGSLAWGQGSTSQGTTSRGMFGQTTVGGTGGASPQGLGQGMTTGMATNQQGQGGTLGGNQNMPFGQATGASGMQMLQRGGQTGFVGASSATIQNPFASAQPGQFQTQNFSRLTQLLTQSRQNQFNRQQAQRNTRSNSQARSQFRVPVRISPELAAAVGPPPLDSQFVQRLAKIPGLSSLGPVQASLEGTTVVLTGTVPTEADRQLAEGLARLEPAVQAVRNELVVAESGTTAVGVPTGR